MKTQDAFRFGLLAGLGVLVAIVIGGAVSSLATIFTYIGAALFLALGLDPLVTWLEKKGMRRPLAILTVLIGVLAVFAGLVLAIIPVIVDQVRLLVRQIPRIVSSFQDGSLVQGIQDTLPWLQVEELLSQFNAAVSNPGFLSDLGGGVLQAGVSFASGFAGTLIIIILVLYFIASLSSLKRGVYQLVPASRRAGFIDISEQINQSVGRYVVGQVTLALVNGVLSFVVLTFIVQVQYSALLAFIAFLGSLIPLVGTISASIVITLGVLLFDGAPSVYWVAGYYLLYMQIEAYVISPRIMTRAVQVPGVVVVIAALAGGTLLGLFGALIAIPVAASIQLIIKQVVVPRQNQL